MSRVIQGLTLDFFDGPHPCRKRDFEASRAHVQTASETGSGTLPELAGGTPALRSAGPSRPLLPWGDFGGAHLRLITKPIRL
jgi:hypothetical protein